MNHKALLRLGIIPPLALAQKHEGKRDNSTDGEEPSSSTPSVVQPLQKDNIMSHASEAAVAAAQPVQQQPAVVEIAPPPAVPPTAAKAYELEFHYRMAELDQRKREWEAQTAYQKQLAAWAEADRSFLNRHLVPAAKFVGGVVTVFGASVLVSWLTGDSTSVTENIPPV